ncbi:MptD family putative ECF transporter S component [Clostridium oceanicum]|uniref:MptD family putative ECF transporter S component n=1 Tax=Clostridium oceanicum TaxID=1543 RepID=A0ABN1JK14_9CLOT
MNKINKFSVRDIITMVILSVLIVVVQLAVNAVSMVNEFFSLVLSSGVVCFLSAPIYVVMIKKVKKPLVTFVYSSILALVYLMMGYWFISIYLILVGIICELFLYKNQNNKQIIKAWTFFSMAYVGTSILPIFIMWDDYVTASLNGGMTMEYINSYKNYYTEPKWIIFIVAFAAISGLIGSYYGTKLTKKHFDKAGVL